jgi:hypothetical protein
MKFYKTKYSFGIKLNKVGDSYIGFDKFFNKFLRIIMREDGWLYVRLLCFELSLEIDKKYRKIYGSKINIDSNCWFRRGPRIERSK